MKKGLDIYNYEQRIEGCLRRLKKSKLSEIDKKLILKFRDHLATINVGVPRQIKYLDHLKTLCQMLKVDLNKATESDLKGLVRRIQEKDYSAWTKQNLKVVIKRFYKWLEGDDQEYPKKVVWIKANLRRTEHQLPDEGELLTEDEVKKLIECCSHPRDKAFICVLFESGARIGEVATLQIGNIVFDELGVTIGVQGKTGSRKIRLVVSSTYLAIWLNMHPGKDDSKSPAWINFGSKNHAKMMHYSAFYTLLKRAFKRTGIKKRSHPHLFRHSRSTFLANHLTEFQMNQYFGWVQGSNMPATYVHMSGKEVDRAILEMHGMSAEVISNEPKIKPIKCLRCEYMNPSIGKFCSKCGSILDSVEAIRVEEKQQKEKQIRDSADELMNQLIKDPEVKELLLKKVEEMGKA